MNRNLLLDALAALPDAEFRHVAVVCHDIAKRLKHREPMASLGKGARAVLDIPEPEPEPEPAPAGVVEFNDGRVVPAHPTPNDVTVGITGVKGSGDAGGLG